MFNVGDKVMCLQNGDGVVTQSNNEGNYRIKVVFEDMPSAYYTCDGKLYTNDKMPMLYPKGTAVKIEPPERKVMLTCYTVFIKNMVNRWVPVICYSDEELAVAASDGMKCESLVKKFQTFK